MGYVMRFVMVLLSILGIFGASAHAFDRCKNIHEMVQESVSDAVAGFERGDEQAIEKAVDDLIFWDSYLHLECGGRFRGLSPLRELAGSGQDFSPYSAAFWFWLKRMREKGVDLSPGGLVRGRRFGEE